MKKTSLLSLLLSLSLLAGCGAPAATAPPEDRTDPPVILEPLVPPEEPSGGALPLPEAGPVYDDSLIQETVIDGEAGDGDEVVPLSYRLPQLLLDGPTAQAVNREILALQDFDATFYSSVSWESHWNDGLLSLVLRCGMPYSDWIEYHIYNYDAGEDRLLTGEEVLARAGLSADAFAQALGRSAAQYFDRTNAGLGAYTEEEPPEWVLPGLLELRAQTLARENLHPDPTQIYLDSEGRPSAVVWISTPAGAGLYPRLMTPALTWEGVEKTAECSFLSAHLQDNAVTVTFHDRDLAGLLLPDRALAMETPYPIEGLYGVYTDLALGFVGNGGDAFLLLLDENGAVTPCDLMAGLDAGPRFVAWGPLLLPQPVDSLYFTSDPDGHSTMAVLRDGSEMDLWEVLSLTGASLHPFLEDSTWVTEDGQYDLTFRRDEGGSLLTWTGLSGDSLQGRPRYLGMTEEGLLYTVPFLSEDGGLSLATLTLVCGNSIVMPEGGNTLTLTHIDKAPLPGLETGASVRLNRTWG